MQERDTAALSSDDPAVDPADEPVPTAPGQLGQPGPAEPAPLTDGANRDPAKASVAVRGGRCFNHPYVSSVGTCQVCRRPLCISCAILIRGGMVGPECLARVLADAPEVDPPPDPIPLTGDRLAAGGFALILALSVFPWSRFGGLSWFSAYRLHWSLIAVLAAAAGLALAVLLPRRDADPRMSTAVYAALGLTAGGALLLHHHQPPSLTDPTIVPLVALIGAAAVFAGVMIKLRSLLRARAPV